MKTEIKKKHEDITHSTNYIKKVLPGQFGALETSLRVIRG